MLPSLVLSYAGQAALVLSGAPTGDNIFYRLCPPMLLPALILLATIATIIASQSIITGAFSMTRQAIQLGWMPRLPVTQTSAEGYGQIYVGTVNWLLMLVTIGLTVGFGKSDNLAAAYGIAVSLTMLMTTVLLFIAMREIWQWPPALAAAVAGALFVIDVAFVSANMLKLADGGYVPLILAALIYGVMLTWHAGIDAIHRRADATLRPLEELMRRLEQGGIARVPGTAIFLTRTDRDTPPVLLWYLKTCRAVQEKVLIITIKSELVPWISEDDHLTIEHIGPNLWRARARFGFMERPDIPALVAVACESGCSLDLSDIIYVVGHETVVRQTGKGRLPFVVAMLFAFLQRNSARATDYFFSSVRESFRNWP